MAWLVNANAGQLQPFHHAIAHVLFRAAVLAGAFGRQQDLLHDTQPGQCTVGVGQRQAPARQLMALGPGLAVGGRAQPDAMQQGRQVVGIGRDVVAFIGIGRGVLMGNSDAFMAGLRARHAGPPPLTIKAADGAWLEIP
jgi:hypothetical protein